MAGAWAGAVGLATCVADVAAEAGRDAVAKAVDAATAVFAVPVARAYTAANAAFAA